jgi:hypothetical protein
MRLNSEATLEDIYTTTDEWRLPVEPLSKRMTIADFLLQGGYGYGSLTEGSLASKILNLDWTKENRPYHYGLPGTTLYNAGYPLQRIVDMGKSRVLDTELGTIDSLTLLAVPAPARSLSFKKQDVQQMEIPADATDAVYVNEKAASLFGLDSAGSLIASSVAAPGGGDMGDVWQKRFAEDVLPPGLTISRILTVKSNLMELMEAAGTESYVIVLATMKGFAANIYCSEQARGALSKKVEALKNCYLL